MTDATRAWPYPLMVKRALVVDDEAAIRSLVRRALGLRDIDVDEAGDGLEGLRRACSSTYDVVLLDLHLPELGGMAVLHRLISSKPGQAVVVSSCQGDAATRTKCLDAGARDFLPKPFSLVELTKSISLALAGPGHSD